MKYLKLGLAAVFGFVLGAALFYTPATTTVKVIAFLPGVAFQRISGTPVGISCLDERESQGVVCYVMTRP